MDRLPNAKGRTKPTRKQAAILLFSSPPVKLQCSNLFVDFQSAAGRVEAIKNLSFETKEGEFLGIVGPSGCGKTTLLRTLAGIHPPTSGNITPDPAGAPGRILLVFQEDGLFPWMTVLDNAAFGLESLGRPRAERHERARRMLERVGLAGREHDYPHQLSVGMKKRVAVIRAFLCPAQALLMDEPFAALDAQTRLRLQGELLDLWRSDGRTVVFVTHDIDEALVLSDRILVLSAGPGEVVGDFPAPFPRPRSPKTTLLPEYVELKERLLNKLGFDWGAAA